MKQSELKKLIHYDSDTGVFTWLNRDIEYFKDQRSCDIWNTRYNGATAGCVSKYGSNGRFKLYSVIRVKGKQHLAHRLAFLYMNGESPVEVDHINGDGTDNRWCNLREVSHAENCRNTGLHKRNKSGMSGIHWCNRDRHWIVRISDNGRSICIGYFKDKFEAFCARKSAENDLHYHTNHGRRR